MARLVRLALQDQLHLVVQRGNNRAAIFIDDQDRLAYLEGLRAAAAASGLAVHAYALLVSEVHLLATPASGTALSGAMQNLGRRYVAQFNRRHGRSGTLWEGRFRATVVDSEHFFLDCLRYVEQAPVRAGLVPAAEAWAWSSAAHHLGRQRDPLVTDPSAFWALGNTPFERESAYRQRLQEVLPAMQAQRIADAQLKGWALGSPAFLQHIAQLTDRPLAPRPRGRPRKTTIVPT
jgi:putative transposase